VCSEQDILIVNGAQQALSLLAQVLLDEGDRVAIEDPTFPVISPLLRAYGAQVLPTPVDEEGMVVDCIPQDRLKMVIVNPTCQFPLGVHLSWQRRQALLHLANDSGVWLVEHDQDSDLLNGMRNSAAIKASDDNGRVVFVGSMSRLLSPVLRLGYLVAPPGLLPDLLRAKYFQDFGTTSVDQLALAHYMRTGRLDRHLRRVASELRRRRAALREGLAQHCSEWLVLSDTQPAMHCIGWLPRCGMHQWPGLRSAGLERGLGLYAVNACAQRGLPSLGLMLGFAGLSVNEIARATAILGEVLSQWPTIGVPVLKRA
jgi:GntR family transcriptional regulator/MocR family aminotransferase